MTARIVDPNEDDSGEFDLSSLECPRCSCNAVDVLAYPQGTTPRLNGGRWSGSWFGARGRARCTFCGAEFSIAIDDAGEDDSEQG